MEIKINRKKLIEARYANGLSVLQLSKKAGVAYLTAMNVEKGKTPPIPSTIQKICDALDVRVEDVVTISEYV